MHIQRCWRKKKMVHLRYRKLRTVNRVYGVCAYSLFKSSQVKWWGYATAWRSSRPLSFPPPIPAGIAGSGVEVWLAMRILFNSQNRSREIACQNFHKRIITNPFRKLQRGFTISLFSFGYLQRWISL